MTKSRIYSILVSSMNITQRVNRIIGQLRGIERMIGIQRECSEVLQQLTAVKKAIDGLSREIVLSDINRYVAKNEVGRVAKMLEQAINL